VVKEGWNGYNVIHDNASRVAALDIGFLPSANARKHSGPVKMVYLLGADDFSEEDVPKDAFVVYQGHHGDQGAVRANVVLPGAAYTEKAGTYVNFEGRVQVRLAGGMHVGLGRVYACQGYWQGGSEDGMQCCALWQQAQHLFGGLILWVVLLLCGSPLSCAKCSACHPPAQQS
jgi:hypothetical protein